METREILQALPSLSASDRLKIAEVALKLSHAEQQSLTKDERKRLLAASALVAIEDYAPGSELLVFSEIEGEDFYEYPDSNP